MWKPDDYIALSALLPAWSEELTSIGSTCDEAEEHVWDFIAYSLAAGFIDYAAPTKVMNQIKIKAGWKHPYEYVVGARIQELAQVIAGCDRSELNELLLVKRDVCEAAMRQGLHVPSFLRKSVIDDVAEPSPQRRKESTATESPFIENAKLIKRRGAKPVKFENTLHAMRHDIQTGSRSFMELRDLTEKELAGSYEVSRETARKALNALTLEIATKSRQIPK